MQTTETVSPTTPGVVEATEDDKQPVTMGLFRTEIRAVNVRMDELNAQINEVILEMRSQRTGVELTGPVIPPADVVVENNSFFAHVSNAVLRHKGRVHVLIVCRFRNSKKHK